jgi:hypothetical protein
MNTTRRGALRAMAGASAVVALPLAAWSQPGTPTAEPKAEPKPEPKPEAKPLKQRPPKLDADLVKQFVGAAHGDLEQTKSLLDATPALLNACVDHGGGDFETALGGASHMGRADIANYLLGKGARLDLFAAAMLGKLEVVKAAIEAVPESKTALGPHRIPLLTHAKKGGENAVAVVAYLESLG